MRLERIKIAGFKSFVDPTVVPMPSQLVGIVGPNGCGKSNVIDAVRWVMGETSAKNLRGESMADVIFNGSTGRKPVGQASVELIFDNGDGTAGGQFAQYAQISVKRQVSRDGNSFYYLNGTRCRRRDIADLFLGTGLGPRSYSIIEQGMISRLIEARPEDLRAFLEEAAGISKYKERRRETETRMRHTRENLDRLTDLIDEVGRQLQTLKRQAAAAERFRELREQERRRRAELLSMRWRELDAELGRGLEVIQRAETALEGLIARQRRLEAEIDQGRDQHTEANEGFNRVQGRFYAVGGEIARTEQAIRFAEETRRQVEQELNRTAAALEQALRVDSSDRERLSEVLMRLEDEEPRLEEGREAELLVTAQLDEAEQGLHRWQADWDQFNRQAAEPAQVAQVERTRLTHLEQQDRQLAQRTERLATEARELEGEGLEGEIEGLEAEEATLAEETQIQEEALQAAAQGIQGARQEQARLAEELDRARSRLQVLKGRRSSLEALQEAALGRKGGGLAEWLRRHQLDGAPRLAQALRVERGWERAVEAVLGPALRGVGVKDLAIVTDDAEAARSGVVLFEVGGGGAQAGAAALPDALAAKVEAPWDLAGLLDGIRTADDLADALALRGSLAPGETFITPDGARVGRRWVRLPGGRDDASGVLEREQELRELAMEWQQTGEAVEGLSAGQEEARHRLAELERGQERTRATLQQTHARLNAVLQALANRRTRLEHLRARGEQLAREAEEVAEQRMANAEEVEVVRRRLLVALEQIEAFADRREAMAAERDALRGRIAALKQQASERRREVQETALRMEALASQRRGLEQGLDRGSHQVEELSERRESLLQRVMEGETPLIEQRTQLEVLLGQRIEVETELGEARERVASLDQALRRLERGRSETEQGIREAQEALNEQRVRRQEVLVRCTSLADEIDRTGYERAVVLSELEEGAAPARWEEELRQIEGRIQRLGAINLAAIEEYKGQSERMTYLEAQRADLTESLETLERAIQKIDRETRDRFKETFERVNEGLKAKFPTLFGGGNAYMELTGTDLLDTGVTVMARPPGKRNSSIHLLSGGEKALTAVALVFSIFELNPAPFCMLDEVDAPLDDANVGRFCELVKSMSDRVQFIVITHNKVTMNMANQLMGVTMQEPGVSRLVSVDVQEAARLAS